MRRRSYLATVASATAGGIAGCSGGGGGDGNGGDGGDGDGAADTETPEQTDAPGGDGTETGGDETTTESAAVLTERWRTALEIDTTTRAYRADATADGVVVANSGGVFSLTADGDRRWHWAEPASFDQPGFAGVTVRDGTAFAAAGQQGVVAALDADGGDVLWRRDRESGTSQPRLAALPVGDYLATTVLDPSLSVLDPESGQTVTELGGVDPILGVGYGGTLVVAGFEKVAGYDPETGEELWRAPDTQIAAQGGRAGNVLVGAGQEQFLGVDLDAGERIWTADYPDDAIPAVTAGGGHVVAQWGRSDGTIRGIDPADGSTAWERSLGLRTPRIVPVLSDGVAVVDGRNGYIALDAESGTDVASTTTAGSGAATGAAAAGTFYACGAEVVAYSI